MEHLTTGTIEKFIKGEYPYALLREISAHILTCPHQCQKSLDRVAPGFLTATEELENTRIEVANHETHFSKHEIEAYVAKEFGIKKRLEMNRHFTKCRECSHQLKIQDPDYLSSFIKDNLGKHQAPEIIIGKEEPESYFKILVPVALFSLLLIVFGAIVLLPPAPNPDEQAKLEEFSGSANLTNGEANKGGNNISNTNENSHKVSSDLPHQANSDSANKIGKANMSTTLKASNLSLIQKQSNQNRTNNQKVLIINNRSLNGNCESNPRLAITPKDEIITDIQPILFWKALPNANAYKIYLSDTENILVEESELIKGEITSYKITNKLEANKKYLWKVVVTLKDGKQVYGESAYFSVGEKAKKFSSIKEKLKVNDVRCVESGH